MDKIIDKLSNIGIDAVLALLQALLILIIGLKVSKWIVKIFKKTKLYKKLDPSVATFLTSALRIVLDTVVFISFAGLIGFPLTSIITILGSVGLAIGMGLQGGLANIAGGIIILYCKPFSVGDFIDTHTDCGTVKSISLFYTTITTLDNKKVWVLGITWSSLRRLPESFILDSNIYTTEEDVKFLFESLV